MHKNTLWRRFVWSSSGRGRTQPVTTADTTIGAEPVHSGIVGTGSLGAGNASHYWSASSLFSRNQTEIASPALASQHDAKHLSLDLFFESAPDGGISSDGVFFEVPPSSKRTVVSVNPQITGTAVRTSQYTGVLRRRKLGTLAKHLDRIKPLVRKDPEYMLSIDLIVSYAGELITELSEGETEGNTREILRSLVNGLRNGGWERIRSEQQVGKLQSFFQRIQTAERIEPEHVTDFEVLAESVGLETLAIPAEEWPSDEEEVGDAVPIPD